MHIFFISEDIPYNGFSGSALFGWACVNYFIERGHKITLFVDPPRKNITKKQYFEQIQNITRLGCEIVHLNKVKQNKKTNLSKINSFFNPEISKFYYSCSFSGSIEKIIKKKVIELNPDILFVYGFPAIYFTRNINNIPRFAPICEDPFTISQMKWKLNINGYRKIRNLFNVFRTLLLSKKIAKHFMKCDLYGQSSEDIRKNFIKWGAKDCKYYNHPLPYNYTKKNFSKKKIIKKFKIILIGSLSTSTWGQYLVLEKYILPYLKNHINDDRYEVHLIGSNKNKRFNNLYDDKNIIFRGYVENIENEFRDCDILLSPTPANCGMRIRILEGFCHGCCIITTKYDQNACPLLIDNYNSLVAKKLNDLGPLVINSLNSPKLRKRLSINAQKTFLKNCKPDVTCLEYEKDMIKLVKTNKKEIHKV